MPETIQTIKSAADSAIAFAMSQIGKPYVLGATGPNAWDCSGLIQGAYRAAGVSLSRTTWTQINDGVAVDPANIQPGDLRFPDPGHVQLYIGNGEIIEAANPTVPVRRTKAWGPAWKVRRVTTPGTAPGTPTNPVDATNNIIPASITDTLTQLGSVTNPRFWARIFIGFMGFGLLFVALMGLLFSTDMFAGKVKKLIGDTTGAKIPK